MILRPYQKNAVKAVFNHWRTERSTLLVQATGTGKTIVFADIARQIKENGGRTLILAHRDELITQAQEKILLAQNLETGIEKASQHAGDEPIVIGSVQTLRNTKRLKRFSENKFTHIIIDEAHHAISKSYQNILDYFPDAKILGVTATPYRGDKKNLSKIFESIAFDYSLIEAIQDGYLAPISTKLIPLNIDIKNVKQSMGDFLVSDIGNALEPYLEQIADIMVSECKNRKTVVFLPLIATSIKFCELLKNRGINACEVNGQSSNRKEILKAFSEGKIDVLCNSMLLTEGWDCPDLDCIINLRPTRSETLYAQIIGRGTRIAPGKKNLLILDFLWQTVQNDLCKSAVLVADNKEQEKKINEKLESGIESDLLDLKEKAQRDITLEREKSLAKELKAKRHKKGRLIDPVQFAISINADTLIDYEPEFPWERKPVTEKQRKLLESKGINLDTVPNLGYAMKLIDKIIRREKLGMATAKQIKKLEEYGFKNVGTWKKEKANKMIGIIANNNWKLPRNIKVEEYA